jgi:hypothetical protein
LGLIAGRAATFAYLQRPRPAIQAANAHISLPDPYPRRKKKAAPRLGETAPSQPNGWPVIRRWEAAASRGESPPAPPSANLSVRTTDAQTGALHEPAHIRCNPHPTNSLCPSVAVEAHHTVSVLAVQRMWAGW